MNEFRHECASSGRDSVRSIMFKNYAKGIAALKSIGCEIPIGTSNSFHFIELDSNCNDHLKNPGQVIFNALNCYEETHVGRTLDR